MGSNIPLVALLGKPPEITDPQTIQMNAERIRALSGQNALQPGQQILQQQQIQGGALALKDEQAKTAAWQQWDHKNPDDLTGLIVRNGGSAKAATEMQQLILGVRQKASEVAKNDAATNLSNLETEQKMHEDYRGRLMSIIGTDDADQQQKQWDAEITKEEQAGQIKPGTVSHTYPGDDQAKQWASHYALGSVLAKEANEKQQTANAAWKPLNGQLVNTATGEKIGANFDVDTLNKALETRYQVLNPGKPLPPQFTLKQGASPEDFSRIDKILDATEKSQGTKSQQDTTNAIRAQTFEMQRDKADLNAVIGTDPKSGRTVLAPMSQAQQMGIQNPMKADADMVNKSIAARHWLQLANGPGDPKGAPADMSIVQLVDKLDNEGKLGPLAGRWNEFMAGKWGSGDPEYAALRAKMGLSTTLLMQAHVGSRGSAQMLEHFEDLANAGKMDGPTLKSSIGSEIAYVQDKAMDPAGANYRKSSTVSGLPAGATIRIKASDGSLHDIPNGSLAAAKKIDPNLQVIQ